MTCLRPGVQSFSNLPLEVINQPAAGYILDLVSEFRNYLEWRFDHDVLQGLLFLALQHISAPDAQSGSDHVYSSWKALILRLQVAGDLAQDEQGFLITVQGEKRRSSTFRDVLRVPAWSQALEQVHEDLVNFAETDGVPLAHCRSARSTSASSS